MSTAARRSGTLFCPPLPTFFFHGLLYFLREITHSRYITLVNSLNLQSCSLLLLLFLLFSWPPCPLFSLRALELALAQMFTSSSLADGTRTVSNLYIPQAYEAVG
jgi:hypothetical protein